MMPGVGGHKNAAVESPRPLLQRMSPEVARHVISLRCNDLYAIGVTADIGRPSGPKGSVENDPEQPSDRPSRLKRPNRVAL